MAVPKALSTHIQDLINGIGDLDRPAIKAKLVRFLRLAEALESGTATRKTEAKITRLKSALEASKSDYAAAYLALENSCSEISNLKSELQTMQAEVAKYQAERTKEEKGEREMPDIQFEILQQLPTEHIGDGATLKGISRRSSVPPDEAAVHLNRLEIAGFAQHRKNNTSVGIIVSWHRTIAGDELVLAKRLAGDEEQEEQSQQPASGDLSKPEEIVLSILARGGGKTSEQVTQRYKEAFPTIGKPIASEPMVLFLLVTLRGKGMVTNDDTLGDGRRWKASGRGMKYLAARGML